MKYFLDTEFLEGTQNKNFLGFIYGKTKSTIDLISIGIVSEDGREYYAISKDFNLKEAWNRYDIKIEWYSIDESNQSTRDIKVYWIRDNVLKPIFIELRAKEVEEYNIAQRRNVVLDFPTYSFCYKELKRLINKYGKSNKQIAEEIKDFILNRPLDLSDLIPTENTNIINPNWKNNIQFYGYYSDYDWVVFCWLFGRMIDLPKGFPMYCIDLKQELDNKADRLRLPNTELSKEQMMETIKYTANYPKQTNEHNALSDALFCKELYYFLNSL